MELRLNAGGLWCGLGQRASASCGNKVSILCDTHLLKHDEARLDFSHDEGVLPLPNGERCTEPAGKAIQPDFIMLGPALASPCARAQAPSGRRPRWLPRRRPECV